MYLTPRVIPVDTGAVDFRTELQFKYAEMQIFDSSRGAAAEQREQTAGKQTNEEHQVTTEACWLTKDRGLSEGRPGHSGPCGRLVWDRLVGREMGSKGSVGAGL